MTSIQLSKTEEIPLNKGGKYNMGITPKKCIKQLVYETENAIRQVSINQRETIRCLAAKSIQQIMSKQNITNREYKQEIRTMKQINQELQQHKVTTAKDNKGKTMVIIYKQDLDEKVNSFIKNNNIAQLKTDPHPKNAKNNTRYHKTM
jgi:hypothetical protein